MKKILFILSFLILTTSVLAQMQQPVHWSFTAKKIAAGTYEIHLTATIDKPWHIYSQTQPEGAINIPVSIVFNKNPLVIAEGKTKEVGRMEKVKDKTTGIKAYEYHGKVDFVQVIKLKREIKTSMGGVINFQVCNEEMCLPPATTNFSITLK